MTYQLTSLFIGLAIAGSILWLVRQAHLHGTQALWWIAFATAVVILGIWPRLSDWAAGYLGIGYPPIITIVLGFGLVLIKMLTMDLERSRQGRRIRRLAQRMALLEAKLEEAVRPPVAVAKWQTLEPQQSPTAPDDQVFPAPLEAPVLSVTIATSPGSHHPQAEV